jgi:hypothetical protein
MSYKRSIFNVDVVLCLKIRRRLRNIDEITLCHGVMEQSKKKNKNSVRLFMKFVSRVPAYPQLVYM